MPYAVSSLLLVPLILFRRRKKEGAHRVVSFPRLSRAGKKIFRESGRELWIKAGTYRGPAFTAWKPIKISFRPAEADLALRSRYALIGATTGRTYFCTSADEELRPGFDNLKLCRRLATRARQTYVNGWRAFFMSARYAKSSIIKAALAFRGTTRGEPRFFRFLIGFIDDEVSGSIDVLGIGVLGLGF